MGLMIVLHVLKNPSWDQMVHVNVLMERTWTQIDPFAQTAMNPAPHANLLTSVARVPMSSSLGNQFASHVLQMNSYQETSA